MPSKVCLVKAMVFPGVMYGYESWTIKKAECWRIDAFELCWRRLLRESLGLQGDQTSQCYRKSTLSIHWKEGCWSSNALVTWCKELTHWKRPWCWERLRAKGEGATEDETVGWHHQLNGHEFEQTPRDSEGKLGMLQCTGSQRAGHDLATQQQQQKCMRIRWEGGYSGVKSKVSCPWEWLLSINILVTWRKRGNLLK